MKVKLSALLLFGALFTLQTGNAQLEDKLNNFRNKLKKKEKAAAIEIKEDKYGVSGVYYVFNPPSPKYNYFEGLSQVSIQYYPEQKKLMLYTSNKDSIEYYEPSYIKKYNAHENCNLFDFSSRENSPSLWTAEPGVFFRNLDIQQNSVTCETSNAESLEYHSFIMSKDKAFIDNMTEEKYMEYGKRIQTESCGCMQEAEAGVKPMPAREMRDPEVEKTALKLIKERAAQQGWQEEITGVYIASKDWSGDNLWQDSEGDVEWAKRINVVITMRLGDKCKWQRAVIAKDAYVHNRDVNGDVTMGTIDGLSISGIVVENNPAKCETIEERLK